MWDTEFAKWLITLGVGGILAGFIFIFYRKDMKMYSQLWQDNTTILVQLVKDQIATNTKVIAAVEALHRRLDEEGFSRATPKGDKNV